MIKLDNIGSNRVVGVIVAYVVIAFAVLEGLDVLVDALALPATILTVAAVLAIVGLPVAAGVAWYTQRREREPEGSADAMASSEADASTRAPTRTRAWKVAAFGAVAAFVVLGAGWWYSSGGAPPDDQPLDPGLVAVMPFGTGGAHPELAWLEQGAMDLLAAKLSGEFGPRALDPRAVLSRLGSGGGVPPEDRALTNARQLGAGLALTGNVVGSPERFTIHAKLNEADTGRERTRASVQSDVDGLAAAADQLVIALLSLDAGEAEHRLATLTSTEPAAVRDYLSGQAHYRQGRYEAAVAAFERALDVDSTFALAGIGLSDAAAMTPDLGRGPRGLRLAVAARENLSPIDRRFLELRSGTSAAATHEGRRRFREQAVREMPDRAELWYLLGDEYFHFGNLIDVPDRLDRAARAFHKAVELDSLHYVAIQHLGWTAAYRGDTAAVRHFVELQKDRIEGEPSMGFSLYEAVATGDTAARRTIEQATDTAGPSLLRGITQAAYDPVWQISAEAADRAVQRLIETAESNAARVDALWLAHDFFLNAGRPAEAGLILDRLERLGEDRRRVLRQRVMDALYWDGHADDASSAVAALETDLQNGLVDEPLDDTAARCDLLQWHAHQGAGRPTHRARLADFAAAPTTAEGQQVWAELCLALVDAVLAWRTGLEDSVGPVAALDSLLALGPITYLRDPANVALARIHGGRGEYERAAQVADRVALFEQSPEDYWSSLKYEKGRWAEQAGDFATAREAYSSYLRLRDAPEPALEAQVEDVRQRLVALSGEIGG